MHNPFDEFDKRLTVIEQLLNKVLELKAPAPEDTYGGIELAVEITKLKPSTIYSHVHNKRIPYCKRGGKLYFSKKELEKWIMSQDNIQAVKQPLFPYHHQFKKAI